MEAVKGGGSSAAAPDGEVQDHQVQRALQEAHDAVAADDAELRRDLPGGSEG